MLFLFSINTCAFVLIFVFKLTKISDHFLAIIAKRAFSNYKPSQLFMLNAVSFCMQVDSQADSESDQHNIHD